MRLADLFEQTSIRWIKAPFATEEGEFRRYGTDLRSAYHTASPTPLTDDIWARLDNTGSYTVRSIADIARNLEQDGVARDISRIVAQFTKGVVACPIILKTGDSYELIAGNTRLSVARVLGVRPEVVMVEPS